MPHHRLSIGLALNIEVASTPSYQETHLYGPCSTAPISFEEALMAHNSELAKALDTSREESTTPEASAATDADQSGEADSASTTPQPDSNEDSGTDSEEMHMESTPAPEAAQSQDQEHAPLATAVSLPAADNQGSSQAQIVKTGKKSTALTPKGSHKKKKARPLSCEQVPDMAASAARPAATPSTFAFGMQGSAEETRGQFVYPQTDLGNAQMFYRLNNKYFMYDHESGQWIGWDNDKKRWLTGRLARRLMMRLVKKLVTDLYRHAQSRRPLRTRNGETVTPEEALAWAKATSQNSRQKAMLEMVRDLPDVGYPRPNLTAIHTCSEWPTASLNYGPGL